jgi:hypothetical protein
MITLALQIMAANQPPKMPKVVFPINPWLVVLIVAVPTIIYYLINAVLPKPKKRRYNSKRR